MRAAYGVERAVRLSAHTILGKPAGSAQFQKLV